MGEANQPKKSEESKEKKSEESKEKKAVSQKDVLEKGKDGHKIHLLTIIGEIEGHETLSSNTKTTRYETVLPQLASIEDDKDVDGMLVLINTVGGDVESGLAIAEMIASLTIPTVSLVLGGSHSIGVPLAVSTDYSFIVPTGTMMIHPVRINGMVIGVNQTYRMMERTQERIVYFIEKHSGIKEKRLLELMLDTSQLVKDVGTILCGKEAVEEGVINEIGGIRQAMQKLHAMIEDRKASGSNEKEWVH